MRQTSTSPLPARLLSANTGGDWREVQPDNDSIGIRQKLLSDVLLSPNLMVLCGLGSSQYLKDQFGRRLAPTMADLWVDVSKDPDFQTTLAKVSFPQSEENIEEFLSKCQLSLALSADSRIKAFVERAEQIIVSRCRFITPDLNLDRHEVFFRKAARRSTRLPRLRLFTTNYGNKLLDAQR